MSEQNTDIGAQNAPEPEAQNDGQDQQQPSQTVNADQVVVNNAPDGGGVDNQPESDAGQPADTEPDPSTGQEN